MKLVHLLIIEPCDFNDQARKVPLHAISNNHLLIPIPFNVNGVFYCDCERVDEVVDEIENDLKPNSLFIRLRNVRIPIHEETIT